MRDLNRKTHFLLVNLCDVTYCLFKYFVRKIDVLMTNHGRSYRKVYFSHIDSFICNFFHLTLYFDILLMNYNKIYHNMN